MVVPSKTPQKKPFLVGKPHGFVGDYTTILGNPPFWTKKQSLSKTSSLTQDELHALSSSCRFDPPSKTRRKEGPELLLTDQGCGPDQVIVSNLSNL